MARPGQAPGGRSTLLACASDSPPRACCSAWAAAPAATGLGTEQPLLAEVKGTLVGNLLALGPRTRVGLVWTGVPVFVPYCHEYGYTPLDRERAVTTEAALGCRSPFAVVSSVVGPSVPLESTGDGTFTIPLRQVPPASVMVGEPGRRVAYASVVLFVDDDGDGELDPRPPLRRGRGRRRPGRWATGRQHGRRRRRGRRGDHRRHPRRRRGDHGRHVQRPDAPADPHHVRGGRARPELVLVPTPGRLQQLPVGRLLGVADGQLAGSQRHLRGSSASRTPRSASASPSVTASATSTACAARKGRGRPSRGSSARAPPSRWPRASTATP
jgi:hypothetical protein